MNNQENKIKQLKNAKRGGYTPTTAKDVNKHMKQKLIKLDKQLDKIYEEKWEEWKLSADKSSYGYSLAIEHVQAMIQEIIK